MTELEHFLGPERSRAFVWAALGGIGCGALAAAALLAAALLVCKYL